MREDFVKYKEEDKTQFLNNPILPARKLSADMDTLCLHNTLKAPDSQKFKEAILEKCATHTIEKKYTST
jgi:hypothetical protein